MIGGEGALVNEAGEEQSTKAGDFALVYSSEKHQDRNKGDKRFKADISNDFIQSLLHEHHDHHNNREKHGCNYKSNGIASNLSGFVR